MIIFLFLLIYSVFTMCASDDSEVKFPVNVLTSNTSEAKKYYKCALGKIYNTFKQYDAKSGILYNNIKIDELCAEGIVSHVVKWLHVFFSKNITIADLVSIGIKSDINAVDYRGLTLLHYAVMAKNKYVGESLIKQGADLNAQCKNGNTPLHTAVGVESFDIVCFLLNYCPTKVDIKNKLGKTPIHLAVLHGSYPIMLKLQANNADIDIPDNAGHTPLFEAYNSLDPKAAALLIKFGADESRRDILGRRPIELITNTLKRSKFISRLQKLNSG